jgi:uncharacterized protein (DUF1499 family)
MVKRIPAGILAFAAVVAAGLAVHVFTASGDTVFSWKRPDNLGVKDGRLAPPNRTPNCVSSQADPADAEHYIAPIAFKGDTAAAMAAARRAVKSMRGASVVRQDGAYLYAEYRTRIMKYVDDLELLFDAGAGIFHVRSASRLGRRDFGVNRARVDALRARIEGRAKA